MWDPLETKHTVDRRTCSQTRNVSQTRILYFEPFYRINNKLLQRINLGLCVWLSVSLRDSNLTGYRGARAMRYCAHQNGNHTGTCFTCDWALCRRMVFWCWSRVLILVRAKLERSSIDNLHQWLVYKLAPPEDSISRGFAEVLIRWYFLIFPSFDMK